MNRHQGQDPYTELGVSRAADAASIKKAYRSLAQKYHPDRNEGDTQSEEKFKRVSAAYAVLSDEERKKQYDEFGDIALDPNFDPENYRRNSGGFQGGHFSQDFGDAQGFGNVFEDLFGTKILAEAANTNERKTRRIHDDDTYVMLGCNEIMF